MPTILDSLIVEIGLDSSKFDAGQKRVQASVHQLRQGVPPLTIGFNERQLRSAFANITDQLNRFQEKARQGGLTPALRKDLDQTVLVMRSLQTQANLMGVNLSRGAQQGAAGFGTLATAALNAFAALKLIDTAFKAINVAGNVTAQGQQIGYAGGGTARMRAIARGAAATTGADEPESIGSLLGLRRKVSGAETGDPAYTELMRNLALLGGASTRAGGPAIVARGAPGSQEQYESILQQIGPALAKLSEPQQQMYGGNLGLGPRLIEALAKGGGVAGLEARGRAETPTNAQTEELNRLTAAVRAFNTALSGMTEKLVSDVAPAITAVVQALTGALKFLQETPAGRMAFGAAEVGGAGLGIWGAWKTISKLFGGGAAKLASDAEIAKAVATTSLVSGFWRRLGALSLLAYLGVEAFKTPTEEQHQQHEQDPTRFLDPRFWFGVGPYGKPRPASDTRTWLQRNLPESMGGKPTPGASNVQASPASFYENVSKAEGTFKNGAIDYNAMYGAYAGREPKPLTQMSIAEVQAFAHTLPPGTAPMGAFQIQGRTTMGDAAKALGIDPNEKFSPENQRRMADWVRHTQGLGAWQGFQTHPDLRRAAEADQGATPAPRGRGTPPGATGWPFPTLPATPQFPNLAPNPITTKAASEPDKHQPPGWPFPNLPATTAFPKAPGSESYGPGSPFGVKAPGLPTMKPDYVFGKRMVRPETDAAGNITKYFVDPKQDEADRIKARWAAERAAGTAPPPAAAAQAASSAPTVSNGGDVNVTLGDTTIHTPATDAAGLARDFAGHVHEEMRRTITVDQFNTGLQ